ncbi:MAG: VCBS repeat-containing protein [Planctomycetes bacterium]|nr:VCBS repeat-containing protein [Planctomycetota bacterium]
MRLLRHRRALGYFGGGLVTAGAAAGWMFWRSRVDVYQPGEHTEGLVDTLARDLPDDLTPLQFVDVTAAAGLNHVHFAATRTTQLPEDMGSGVAVGDVDGDGRPDLFFANESGPMRDLAAGFPASNATSRLYRNLGDGRFEDVTERAGVGLRALAMAGHLVDIDGDRDLDLLVSTYGRCRLFRNDGALRFADVSESSGVAAFEGFWTGIAVGDYDRDDDVDLYVCGYVQYDPARLGAPGPATQYGADIPAALNPSTFRPERNLLLRNRGDGTFEEQAAAAGVANSTGRSLAATFADLTGDGWPDLYVANDVSDNAFFVNRRDGTFEDKAAEALVADYRGAMGLAVGDFDGDLDPDLFITHWIAQENALYVNRAEELPAADAAEFPSFQDQADRFGLGQIALDKVGWGTGFADFDNDGRRDLFVVNGSTIPVRGKPEQLVRERSHLFWNAGERRGYFEFGAVASEFLRREHVGRGGALLDLEMDGDADLIVVRHGEAPALLRNDGGDAGGSLLLRLRQSAGNTLALGADVRIHAGGRVQVGEQGTDGSYLSQHAAGELAFGVGVATTIDRIEVAWPDGTREQAGPFPARSLVTWVKGSAPRSESLEKGACRASTVVARKPDAAAQKRFFALLDRAGELRIAGEMMGAAQRYREALALQPGHEDSLYYLGNCLLEIGHEREAIAQFEALLRANPESSRACMQIGRVRLPGGDSTQDDLAAAEEAFERAHAINGEESGPVVALGVVALLREDLAAADRAFADAAMLNLKSVEARYLRSYVAWLAGRREPAAALLAEAHAIAIGTPPVTAKVVGEGDTRSGKALTAVPLDKATTPLERWKSLAQRAPDVDAEFQGVRMR